MNKDVIYIDVEDDVTAIIGKIKACKENIVALVPPKHVGILQSAVNLRLLDRMANSSHKRLVLITNNQALIGLSSVAGIPVAKNLQSKPELAPISVLNIDDGEDIIDGSTLPIGELAQTARKSSPSDDISDKDLNTIQIDDDAVSVAALGGAIKNQPFVNNTPKSFKGAKVPNFTSFRKKLFLGIAVIILLIGLIVWAFVFAPAAKVIVTARTTPVAIVATPTIGGDVASDLTKGVIKSVTQQTKNDVSVDFTATGQKDTGNKAAGTMNIARTSISSTPLSVPAGTTFTSGDYVFVSTQSVTLAGTQVGTGGIVQDSTTVNVQAANPGDGYNLSARSYSSSVTGISANGSTMSGGTTNIVKVVTADDVQKAAAQLAQQSSDAIKQQLIKQFTGGEVVISDSFTVTSATPVSAPSVDAQSTDGKAKLVASTTYAITAIAKPDLELFLKDSLNKQLVGNSAQRAYDDGISKVQVSGYNKAADGSATIKINSTGQIGPTIDEAKLKDQIKGKIFGDVQSIVSAIPGVDNVDVQFSYPWVRNVPNDVKKITIQFKVQNAQ